LNPPTVRQTRPNAERPSEAQSEARPRAERASCSTAQVSVKAAQRIALPPPEAKRRGGGVSKRLQADTRRATARKQASDSERSEGGTPPPKRPTQYSFNTVRKTGKKEGKDRKINQ